MLLATQLPIGNTPANAMIPGGYERGPRVPRQPGAMGGEPFGSDSALAGTSTLSTQTITEREKEGGGGASERGRSDRSP